MDGILKVTPEKLIMAAGEFGDTGGRIRMLTSEMLESIQRLKGVWQGEAAEAYHGRFLSLEGDMNKMHRMIQEHVEDLQEMARQYQQAETANLHDGSSLNSSIIL